MLAKVIGIINTFATFATKTWYNKMGSEKYENIINIDVLFIRNDINWRNRHIYYDWRVSKQVGNVRKSRHG